MSNRWRSVALASVLMVAPMLASCGSGQPSVTTTGATLTQPSSSTSGPPVTASGGVATTQPTTSQPTTTSTTAGPATTVTTRPATTTPAPGISDAQVTALEQTLSAIDVILANLDKSLAADVTLAP
jgi:hypothetical protein